MTGSLFAPLPLSSTSPASLAASNYSVDSFSEYSTRNVNRASCSLTSVASGPRSGRAKEDDEELFRDLFAAENEVETKNEFSSGYKIAAPRFVPQKPATKRILSSTGNSNPRQHLAPMKSTPPQPVLSTPCIPRLKLEELVIPRPDDDSGDHNNNSRRTSRLHSELGQVTEEDESCFDDAGPRKNYRGFNHGLGFSPNNEKSDINDILDQETLRFLDKLDLKAVLHTPRPDILSFYPTKSTTRSMASPQPTLSNFTAKQTEDHFCENRPESENDQIDVVKRKSGNVIKDHVKVPRDNVASRLAYMKSMYGTAPIVRKTRRETIDRLANPISGHSSTLQALPPKQREKREAVLTTRAPLNPTLAVTSRRSTTTKKSKILPTRVDRLSKRGGDCEILMSLATSKRKINKQGRSNSTNTHTDDQVTTTLGLSKRKSKTVGSHSLVARKEALKKKLQRQSGPLRRGKIGGSTFLTQRDDEEGVELIEDFIARKRGAAQTLLTFRTNEKVPSRQVMPALPKRTPSTSRSRSRLTQTHTGATFTRASSAYRSTFTERTNERPRAPIPINLHRGSDHEPVRTIQQPRRPQMWQTNQKLGNGATSSRSLSSRPTSATNPLRNLKVHPVMPALLPHAPKAPPSAASTVLMGSAPLFSISGASSEVKSARAPRRGTQRISRRKVDTAASFGAPTKASEQHKRTSTTGAKAQVPRQTFAGRRSTSRV